MALEMGNIQIWLSLFDNGQCLTSPVTAQHYLLIKMTALNAKGAGPNGIPPFLFRRFL